MVGEPDLVALARGVDHKVSIEVEEEAAHCSIVDLSASISLVLTYDLAAVLVDEVILLNRILHEYAPPGK